MFPKSRLLGIALLVLLASWARAATINVGPGQAYTTIQAGITAANTGDTVLVAPGTYYENIDFKGKAITVTSSGGAAVTFLNGLNITPPAVTFHSGEQRDSVLSNFTIRNGGYANMGAGVYIDSAAPTILNNVITGNNCANVIVHSGAPLIQGNTISSAFTGSSTTSCPYAGSGVVVTSSQQVGAYSQTNINGNTIENNPGAAGVVLDTAEGAVVQGNTLRNNQGLALFATNTLAVSILQNVSYGNAHGFSIGPPGATVGPFLGVIAGNTITDGLLLGGNIAQYVVVNNILLGSSAGAAVDCTYYGPLGIPASFDHNDIYNPAGTAPSSGCPAQTGMYGNISADPQFVSAVTGNYQLLATSPAIDAGNNSAPLLPSTDFVGTARIQIGSSETSPIVDMGAFEYAGKPDSGHTVLTLTPSEYFASANPTPPAPPLTLTATFSAAGGSGGVQPVGAVAFYEDGTRLGKVQTSTSGVATFTPNVFTRGVHAFTAVYPAPGQGIPGFTAATSVKFFLLVPDNQSGITITASPQPAQYGDYVTFNVTCTAPDSPVTLTDSFTNSTLATLQTSSQNMATYQTNHLAVGTHGITATYAGSSTLSSASASLTEIVNPAVTTATLRLVSPMSGPITPGTAVTLAATIAATNSGYNGGNLAVDNGGTVYFYDNTSNTGFLLGSGTLTNGVATASFTGLAAGTHNLTCQYNGDMDFGSSTCGVVIVNVSPPLAQTITFPQPPAPAYAVTAVALAAISSSGLPVTYTVVSGPATVSGTTLSYFGSGTVVVEADQTGNGSYAAASPVQDTISVSLLTEPLNVASTPVATLVTFLQAGTLGTITVTSQGAVGLDFSLASGGTCAVGTAYTAGQTCIVDFTFNPLHPGLRFGGIAFTTSSGTLLANSYLLGYGTGPQILYNPPNQTNVGSGFGGLSGVAVDGSGNVYAADILGNGIYQIAPSTGATRLLASVNDPVDVAVDGSGNVFYASRTIVYEALAVNGVLPASPTIRTLSSGYNTLDGLKVDANGNVFLAEGGAYQNGVYGNGAIYQILAVNGSVPATPVVRTLEIGTGSPTGVAIDVAGDVFFSSQYDHSVYELQAVNGTIPASAPAIVVNNSFGVPANVTFDVSGNLYVPDYGTHDVQELLAVNGVLPANPTIIQRGVGLVSPAGATVDAGGNLFVADEGLGQVVELAYGNAPTLTFASTIVGQTSSDSPKSLTITNGGNANLIITGTLPGAQNPTVRPTSFVLDGSSTCPVLQYGQQPASVAVGASCTYAIDFTPVVQGPITGDLYLGDNNLGVNGAIQTIPLKANGIGIAPTIVFTVPNHTFGDFPFAIAATSNSAGAFTYSVVSGPATISGNTVTLTGAGTVTLLASQAASGIYAAGTATATFQVAKEPQTIHFQPPVSPVQFGIAPISLTATATSGLPVVFTVLSGPGQISGNTLTVLGGGTIVIAADQPGNANFAAAPEVSNVIVVGYGPATVTLTGTPNPVFLLNPLTLNAAVTGAGGVATGSVTFKEGNTVLGSGPVANGSASISLSTLSVGLHTIIAYYSGDANFAAVASAPLLVTVQDFSLTITNPSVVIDHGGTAVYNLVVNSIGGVGLASTINLSMAGGPNHAVSSFSTAVIASGSGSTPVTLTVHTPNYPDGPFGSLAHSRGGITLALLSLGGFALGLWRKRKLLGRGVQILSLVLLLLAGAGVSTVLSGCGSGWRTQGWTLTVTATSGNLSRSATATLTSECKDGQQACPIY